MKKLLFLLLLVSTLFSFNKFLMPNEAFIPNTTLNDSMQIEVTIKLAKDIYIYEKSIKFEIINSDNISINNIDKPKSIEHDGDKIYLESPTFLITLKKELDTIGAEKIDLKLSYQGCSEQGLCYEPITKTYTFEIDSSKLDLSLQTLKINPTNTKTKIKVEIPTKRLSQTDSIAKTISSGNIGLIILTFLGFGLLLSLTPCVFPMIPIISGLIISQGKGISVQRAFFLSLIYVLAMSVAYTIAGVLAGLFGSNLQASLQTPWVIYSFSAIFVALALSMFGFYELKLPDSLVNKVSGSQKSSGVLGIAIMGFLSALIVGPCVAAPLAGALVYIGQTGDALLGGMALFTMSIGMGIPLIVVGVSAGKFMPKPGVWMTMVSAIFGVMMLAVAIWMLERVVSEYITMLLYSMLGLGFSLYLGAFEKDGHIFKRSIAIITFIYSVALFIGALGGSTSMSKPLEFLKPQMVNSSISTVSTHPKFKKISSIKELDIILEKNKGKKILLDFSAEWCTACQELEEITFSNSSVKKKMKEFILIQADVTDNNEEQKALSKKYGIFGPPALLFFEEDGKLISSKTIIGFIEPDEFLKHLNSL